MTERLTAEELAWCVEHFSEWSAEGKAFRELQEARATIDALEAENKRLREALSDVAYNTSSSVPLGQWPVDHYRDMMHRCVGIAARIVEEVEG